MVLFCCSELLMLRRSLDQVCHSGLSFPSFIVDTPSEIQSPISHYSILNHSTQGRRYASIGPSTSRAMQRSSYAPPPAHSPPLHHPVPQHVSTVPMMRSPPPPQSQSNSNYGSPYGGQAGAGGGGGGAFAPAFGGFMNDGTAQMGYQVGKSAFNAGQEIFEQNVRLQFFHFFPTSV